MKVSGYDFFSLILMNKVSKFNIIDTIYNDFVKCNKDSNLILLYNNLLYL